MKDCCGALYTSYCHKIVEPFFNDDVNNSTIFLSRNIFNRLYRTYQKETARIEYASKMACWTGANRSATDHDVLLVKFADVFEKTVDNLSIILNLFRSDTCVPKNIEILVYTISRIFHADDVDFQFLHNLIDECLSHLNILTICMEMQHYFLRVCFIVQAWNKVFGVKALGLGH